MHEALELVEQFAIALGDRIDDAGQHWLNFSGALSQKTVNHVLFDSAIKLVLRNKCRIKKGASILATREQVLLEKTIECGHERGVSNSLFERAVNISHADLAEPPRLFEHLTFEFAEGEAGNFTRTSKSAQQKSRRFHVAGIFGYYS